VTGVIHAQVGEQNVAAVLIEPIQGEGGFIVPPPGFLAGLAGWCRSNGIILIADEIQTGFCRTGQWFACEHEGVVPDLITTAKGIADGLPLAAVTGRAELMDAVHVGGLGGTYGGNPVACAAALAVLDTIERDGLLSQAERVGRQLSAGITAAGHHLVAGVRGRGLWLAVVLAGPVAADVEAACRSAGYLVNAVQPDAIRLAPPLILSPAEAAEFIGELPAILDGVPAHALQEA
jgi:4-aminobutyrate aminotransferase/(S)-3-amino-2-methylpropionate transaminase